MGRWRPPQPASSPFITPQGFEMLQRELADLWKRRADVVKALAAAAAEGDRSENAEYIYRKKELGGLDRRIRYLQKRLPDMKVVRDHPDGSHVFFGARVTLERDDGSVVNYRIVGADETDGAKGWISIDSPVAKALLKKQVDDDVEVTIGERQDMYRVTRIRY